MKHAKGISSINKFTSALEYNPETGVFIWKKTYGKEIKGSAAGHVRKTGYVSITVDVESHFAHRIAWAIYTGDDISGVVIDHIDGNKSNNAISNLRICQQKQNCQNRKKGNKNNTSGYIGVFLDKRRGTWSAQITKNRKVRSITGFKSAKEASDAYIKAKRETHEFCTI